MKFKEFKIDLGGSYPAKSEAVQRHGQSLGYRWCTIPASIEIKNLHERWLCFDKDGDITFYHAKESFDADNECKAISFEKFLELTKKDVIEKEPELFYRYRIWFDDGCILDTAGYCKPNVCNILEYASGTMVKNGDFKIIKFERIGEGVAKCAGQK
jgi:hypothetical protein